MGMWRDVWDGGVMGGVESENLFWSPEFSEGSTAAFDGVYVKGSFCRRVVLYNANLVSAWLRGGGSKG